MVTYLFFFLPGLYVEHSDERNRDILIAHHIHYLETGNMDMAQQNTAMTLLTVKLEDNNFKELTLDSYYLAGKIEITDAELRSTLAEIYPFLKDLAYGKYNEQIKQVKLPDIRTILSQSNNPAIKLQLEKFENWEISEDRQNSTFFKLADNSHVYSSIIVHEDKTFSGNLAFTAREGELIITLYSTAASSIDEILPIVLLSLPVLIASILLLVIIASLWFSRHIVKPMEKVSQHTDEIMEANYEEVAPLKIGTKDEINELAENIDKLYAKLRLQYDTMEHEHKAREVFLRAGSHRLKTPITVSLLLIESMINKVGKYKDTELYLPKVKAELINMRQIIDKLLDASTSTSNISNLNKLEINVLELIRSLYQRWNSMLEEKSITLKISGNTTIITDQELFAKLLEYVVENSIKYCDPDGKISVEINEEKIIFRNNAKDFDPKSIEDIFEAFVTENEDGHGLGLYFTKYFSSILDFESEMKYKDGEVILSINI